VKIQMGSVLFLILFSITVFGQAGPKPGRIDDGTKAGFSILLEDPINRAAYREAQGRFLATSHDLVMSEFLNSTPFLLASKDGIQTMLLKAVEDALESGDVSMDLVTEKDSNPLNRELYQLFKEVLIDSGRTKQEISQARLYITLGNVNAYTVSGKDAPIVVVVQTDLLTKFHYDKVVMKGKTGYLKFRLLKSQIKGILAHENFHTLRDHVTQSVQTMALDLQVMNYFSAKPITLDDKDDDSGRQKLLNDMATSLIPDYAPLSGKTDPRSGPMDKVRRDGFLNAVRMQSAKIDGAPDRDAVLKMLQDYLDLRISLAEVNGEIGPEALALLRSLKTATPNSIDKEIIQRLFIEKIHPLDHREQEASADGGTFNSVSPREGAAPHTVFGGAMLTTPPMEYPEHIAEIEGEIVKRFKQNEEIYKNVSSVKRQNLYGGKNDHAFSSSRVQSIIDNSQQPDVAQIQGAIDALTKELKVNPSPSGDEELAVYNKLLTQQNSYRESAIKNAQAMAQDISNLIGDLGVGGNSLRSNPRLVNLIEYQLSRKNQLIRAFEILNKLIADNVDPTLTEEAKLALADYQNDMNLTDTLLQSVKESFEKALPLANAGMKVSITSRIKILDAAMAKDIIREKVAEISRAMNKETLAENRKTRILPDAEVSFRSSSIRGKYDDQTQELVDRKMKAISALLASCKSI
jgi:tetratricopeptide (TPR) repeat protein